MRSNYIIIGIFIVALIILIYIAKKYYDSQKYIDKKIILASIIICIVCRVCINFWEDLNSENNSNKNIIEIDEMIEDEINKYNELISKEYEKQNSMNPYIPNGFQYVDGEWNSGFVIQDDDKNQYVWVPCTNKDNDSIVKLQRINTTFDAFINYNDCNNLKYEDFIESALTYGGFYVSRYELGEKEGKIFSQKDIPIIKDITREKAIELIDSINYSDLKCEMINGYAYDTIYQWLNCKENINNRDETLNSSLIVSGRNVKKNIYDFEDNVLEYTMENLYDTVIIRGIVNSNNVDYTNDSFSKQSRYCILKNEYNYGILNVNSISIALRTILYK